MVYFFYTVLSILLLHFMMPEHPFSVHRKHQRTDGNFHYFKCDEYWGNGIDSVFIWELPEQPFPHWYPEFSVQ